MNGHPINSLRSIVAGLAAWRAAARVIHLERGEFMAALVLPAFLAIFSGCGFLADTRQRPRVVLYETTSLQDGYSQKWDIPAGFYQLELSATNDGVAVEWLGSPCEGARETRYLSATCRMDHAGKLKITNPTTFGLGKDSTVTVKVTWIPDEPR